ALQPLSLHDALPICSASGSTRVLQTVMDGVKLQECNPTFPSGRDAIIAADIASTGGANRCMIWETFAKRGVGLDASAGSKGSIRSEEHTSELQSREK